MTIRDAFLSGGLVVLVFTEFLGASSLEVVGQELCNGINDYSCAQTIEKAQLVPWQGYVERQGNTLLLKNAKSEVIKRLVDDQEGPGKINKAYSLVTFLPEIDYFLIHVDERDSHSHLLVHRSTGNEIPSIAVPQLSPDHQRLAFFQAGNPFESRVVRLMAEGYVEEPVQWGASSDPRLQSMSARWVSPERIRIACNLAAFETQEKSTISRVLVFQKGAWVEK